MHLYQWVGDLSSPIILETKKNKLKIFKSDLIHHKFPLFQSNIHNVHLHIVTSALHVDTLAILTGELIYKASTQLEEDAGKIQVKCQR